MASDNSKQQLRHFEDIDDLFDTCSNEQILEWVNAHADSVAGRKGYQRRYQERKRLLAKYAREHFDQDELARIEQIVEERIAGQLASEDEEPLNGGGEEGK